MVFVWCLLIFIMIIVKIITIIIIAILIIIIITNMNLILQYVLKCRFWRLEKGAPCPGSELNRQCPFFLKGCRPLGLNKKLLTDYFLNQSVRAAAWHREIFIKDGDSQQPTPTLSITMSDQPCGEKL